MDSWVVSSKPQDSDAESGHLDEILQMLEVSSTSWSDNDMSAAFLASSWGDNVPSLLSDWSAQFLDQAVSESSLATTGFSSDGIALPATSASINPLVSSSVTGNATDDNTRKRVIETNAAIAAISFRGAVDAGDYSDYMLLPDVSDPPESTMQIVEELDSASTQVPPFQQSASGKRNSVDQVRSNIEMQRVGSSNDIDDDDDDDAIDPLTSLATQFAADMAATEQLALRASEAAALVAEQGADVGLRAFEQLVDGVEGALYFGDVRGSF